MLNIDTNDWISVVFPFLPNQTYTHDKAGERRVKGDMGIAMEAKEEVVQ